MNLDTNGQNCLIKHFHILFQFQW